MSQNPNTHSDFYPVSDNRSQINHYSILVTDPNSITHVLLNLLIDERKHEDLTRKEYHKYEQYTTHSRYTHSRYRIGSCQQLRIRKSSLLNCQIKNDVFSESAAGTISIRRAATLLGLADWGEGWQGASTTSASA